jgi:hypothetical protein
MTAPVLSPSTKSVGVLMAVQTPMNSPDAQRPDPSGYRFTACIDWIQVEFTMPRACGSYWLHLQLARSYVRAVGSNWGTFGVRFQARFQDPQNAEQILGMLKGVGATAIRVSGIEVAVDLYPKTDAAREAMPLMAAHLLRGLKNPQDFARFGGRGPRCEQIVSFGDAHRRFAEGKCCYLGHRNGRHQQRIYVKRTDKGGLALDPAEHRVRVENTYFDRDGLARIWSEGLKDAIGRDDFAFRRLCNEVDALQQLLACRTVQVGTRVLRSSRVFYARNTKADIELNRRVADALRSLIKRWAVENIDAEIADQSSASPEGNAPSSNNYTSLNTYILLSSEGAVPVRVVSSTSVMRYFRLNDRGGILSSSSSPTPLGPITKWDIAMTVPVLRLLLLGLGLGRSCVQVAARWAVTHASLGRYGVEMPSMSGVRGVYSSVYSKGTASRPVDSQSRCSRAMSQFSDRRGATGRLKNVDECCVTSHCTSRATKAMTTAMTAAPSSETDPGSLRNRRGARTGGRHFVSTPRRKAWISMSNVANQLGAKPMSPC